MHICFINMPVEYYSPVCGGAVATIIMEVSKSLIARGHDVTVISAIPPSGHAQYDVGQVVPMRLKGRDDMSFVQRRVAGLFRRLHAWDWPYYGDYLNCFRQALRGLPTAPDAVIVFNDLVSQKYIRRLLPQARIACWLQNEWRTNQRNLREMVAATDCFMTCSTYIRDWTARTHGIPLEKFAVVTSGIDLERFFPRSDYRAAATPLKALYIGRIDPNKGPDLAIDAVAALRAQGHAIELTVAGGLWFYQTGQEMRDPYFTRLKSSLDGLGSGARYLGHVTRDKVPALIREHDVSFVLSRSNEPFGLVVLEAMASGLAVISSSRGGLPEACDEAGFLVDPDKPEEIQRVLKQLVLHPEVLRQHKDKSVARARRAPWSAVAECVLEAIGPRVSEAIASA